MRFVQAARIAAVCFCGAFWMLVIFGILALAGCAHMPGVAEPPTRYDTLPPGVTDRVIPAPDIGAECRAWGVLDHGGQIQGCYIPWKKLVIRPTFWSDPLIAEAVRAHEYAHAWGWEHDPP